MVLVVGRQGIAGSKVHPTELRGELFCENGTFLGEQGIKWEVLRYFLCKFSPYFGDKIYNGTTYKRFARREGYNLPAK